MNRKPASNGIGQRREKLYLQLAQLFRNKIANGSWPLGSSIPTLPVLMTQHQVSRTTVRMAIASLIADGLLATHKRGGTHVTAKPHAPPSFLLPATWNELVQFGKQIKPQTLVSEAGWVPNVSGEQDLQTNLASSYQRVLRVHLHDGTKFCFSELYLEQSLYKQLEYQLRRKTLAEALGNDPARITRARQRLRVIPADDLVANALSTQLGTSLLQALRWAYNPEGTIVYLARVNFLSEYVHMEIDLLK